MTEPLRANSDGVENKMTQLIVELHRKLDAVVVTLGQSQSRYLTIENAATYTDLSAESIRRLIVAGKLTALRPVRGRILLDRQELDAMIRASTAKLKNGRGKSRQPKRLTTIQ